MSISEDLITISENVKKVFEAGKRAGGGGDSAFWDAYQQNGNRTAYRYAFSYGWTNEAFRPKYKITPVGEEAQLMFRETNITDLAGLLVASDVSLDCSQATNLYQAFESKNITSIPPLDLSACKDLTLAFRYVRCTTITLNNLQPICTFDRTFNSCANLENLTITGTIGTDGFNVTDCKKLSKDSLLNILSCLSGDGEGKTVTLGADHKQTLINNGHSDKIAEAEAKGWTVE